MNSPKDQRHDFAEHEEDVMVASSFSQAVPDGTPSQAELDQNLAPTGSAKDEETASIVQRLAGTIMEAWRGLIRPVDEQVASNHEALCKALQNMTLMSGEIQALNTEVSQLRTSVEELRSDGTALAAKSAASADRFEQLSEREAAMHDELAGLSGARARMEAVLKSNGESISRLAQSVASSQKAVDAVRESGNFLLDQMASAAADIANSSVRLRACEDSQKTQADAAKALNELFTGLQTRQKAFEKRIETQAGAIRVLHSNLQDLVKWLEKLRETMIKVEDVVRTCGNTAQKPEWFPDEVVPSPSDQVPPTNPT